MTTDTLFRIASMSKPVTSVAVMILVDDGRLTVSDPVSKYLPEFKNPKVLVPGSGGDFKLVPAGREICLPTRPAVSPLFTNREAGSA